MGDGRRTLGGRRLKTVGILTEDFALSHDLIRTLRERGLPIAALQFGEPVPAHVGVIVTTPGEKDKVRFQRIVVVRPDEPLETALGAAQRVLEGEGPYSQLVIGIDPGARPGVAILGDAKVLRTAQVPRPEMVAAELRMAVMSYPAASIVVRVGSGDPTARNRILNAVHEVRELYRAAPGPAGDLRLEISDERRTSRPGVGRDQAAAVRIGSTPGVVWEGRLTVEPTDGEVRDVQRLSRIRSGGRVTISKVLANRVAKGEVTIEDAVAAHMGEPRPQRRRRKLAPPP